MFVQQLINGLTLGAVYTLLALAFSVVMGVLGVLNLAIAALFMFGGMVGFTLLNEGYSLAAAIAVAMLSGALLSAVVERWAYRPLRQAPLVMPMLSTVGFSIILQNIATNYWGTDPLQLPDGVLEERIAMGTASISESQAAVIVVTVLLVIALALIIRYTNIGRALRAIAENRDVARSLGVSVTRTTVIAFVLSGLLAGGAGVLVGLHYAALTPYSGEETGLKAIAVMVLGGMSNVWGALLTGPIVGVAEVMTVAYGGAELRDFIVYGIMLLMLLLRPEGVFGETRAEWKRRV